MIFLTELERHIKSGDYKRATTLLYNHSRAIAELVRAAQLGSEYDLLLRRYAGPRKELLAGDVAEIDAAYDKWQAANSAALAALNGGQHGQS